MLKNRKSRTSKEINAGSMADIAFLLLIFFLVTTTISAEKGIMAKLPPYEENPSRKPHHERNILSVKMNFNNNLLVENELMDISELRGLCKRFITNNGKDPNLSDNPRVAVVSIINDRATSYHAYISVYNEVKAAYNEIWETESQRRYNIEYEKLEKPKKKKIQEDFPLVISEAEPHSNK